jgi:hypothetical protein
MLAYCGQPQPTVRPCPRTLPDAAPAARRRRRVTPRCSHAGRPHTPLRSPRRTLVKPTPSAHRAGPPTPPLPSHRSPLLRPSPPWARLEVRSAPPQARPAWRSRSRPGARPRAEQPAAAPTERRRCAARGTILQRRGPRHLRRTSPGMDSSLARRLQPACPGPPQACQPCRGRDPRRTHSLARITQPPAHLRRGCPYSQLIQD